MVNFISRLCWISLFLSSVCFAGADPFQPSLLTGQVIQEQQTEIKAIDEAQQHWQLQSILSSSGRKMAMINNQLVSLGGKIDQAIVTRIETNAVYLKTNGNALVKLELFNKMVNK